MQLTLPVRFEDQPDFNDYVDEAHGSIQIFELSFRASEVLYRLDQEAYRDALASFDSAEDEDESTPADSPLSSSGQGVS